MLPISRRALLLLLLVLSATFSCGGRDPEGDAGPRRTPVLYCTDLFHPHDDPDDHFDLACLFALPELDVKGIVLDQGERQAKAPGRIPVAQMNHLTGRNVPCASGLSAKLSSADDTGVDQPADHQRGVELILSVLREAGDPVTLITVGSVRDVAAAFNRAPNLFRAKVARLVIFIGAVDTKKPEWNVMLDPHAFVCVMNSGLPVFWVPCFDGGLFRNAGRASFWRAPHRDLLRHAQPDVFSYFAYALSKSKESDWEGFFERERTEEEQSFVRSGTRNLWCTAIFPFLAGRVVVRRDGEWMSIPPDDLRRGEEMIEPFRFEPVSLTVSPDAKVHYDQAEGTRRIRRFRVLDRERYAEVMTSVTAHLLGSLR